MAPRLTRTQQQQRTRQLLINAAERLFAERGIHQTSLDDVAAEAGLTKGAIYANFDGKSGLVDAILAGRNADGHEPAAGSASDVLHRLGESFGSNILLPEHRRFAMAFLEFWLYSMRNPTSGDTVAQWLRSAREANLKQIAEQTDGEPAMPPEQLAALLVALEIGVGLQHLIDPENVPADLYAAGLAAIAKPK
ncbi:TetR/AcrR family transcriptional regulator [Micromonospora sp. LH3U1]|uniref:TetR/AcrR family transcriptional regulator n=1 Tax=Micromonospora sp. LH3U1 TaxID=3018339 RepID=UPI00234B56D3|nr:TetR/AcrR family transcriptional regulator [Micromonospora sp. LH3U1]WCN79547.1 TetR/AcrR family transcriptional regulator [Micromonospora sp. LH3U1]